MAKSNLNVVMQGASGKIGKTLVFRQMHNGETVIANRPKSRISPLTPGEEAFRERFLRAAYLAKKISKDPMFKPQYEAKSGPGKSAYSIAMTDCLSVPKIVDIDLNAYNGAVGDTISVYATDDFMVTSVKVRILAADDTLIEEGLATLDDIGLDWLYTATASNSNLAGSKIEATAYDIPRNETVKTTTIN